MKLNSQTRVIVGTAAALAVIDIAVRLIPFGHNTIITPTSGNVVRAQQFSLVDQWGNERATLGLDANGEPGIKLFDRNGTMRAQLDTFENTPSLILCDRDGQRRSYYGMDNETGNSILEMMDANGQSLTNISVDGNSGHVTFSDANGNDQTLSPNQMISNNVSLLPR